MDKATLQQLFRGLAVVDLASHTTYTNLSTLLDQDNAAKTLALKQRLLEQRLDDLIAGWKQDENETQLLTDIKRTLKELSITNLLDALLDDAEALQQQVEMISVFIKPYTLRENEVMLFLCLRDFYLPLMGPLTPEEAQECQNTLKQQMDEALTYLAKEATRGQEDS